MKIKILDKTGKPSKELNTDIFNSNIREDIVQKIAECEKISQEYAPFFLAGMQTSASGNAKHNRHVWKTDRGKGLSRVPKKRMSDKGERFVWEGAVIPGTRGGRRAHPPKLGKRLQKINKKEYLIGLKSSLAMVASLDRIKEKYQSLKEKKVSLNLPIVIESKALELKTKDFLNFIKKITEEAQNISIQKRKIRAGVGKIRNRRYKVSSGVLLVIGAKEEKKINGVEVIKADELRVTDLASNGARLTIFTESSINEIERRIGGENVKVKGN